jgi:hypothetical protein
MYLPYLVTDMCKICELNISECLKNDSCLNRSNNNYTLHHNASVEPYKYIYMFVSQKNILFMLKYTCNCLDLNKANQKCYSNYSGM